MTAVPEASDSVRDGRLYGGGDVLSVLFEGFARACYNGPDFRQVGRNSQQIGIIQAFAVP